MKKIIFYSIFIFINLFFIELILSHFDVEKVMLKSFDKNYLFKFYPNRSGRIVSEEYNVVVTTNSTGYRQNSEIQKSNSSGSILLIGDSFTEGWGVEETETYSHILNHVSKSFHFYNFGLHGSSPILFALQLSKYLEVYSPKKVIVQLFDNDLDDNEKLEQFINLNIKSGEVISPKPNLIAKILGEQINNYIKESSLYRLTSKIYKTIRKQPSPILYYKENYEPKVKILSHEESIQKYGHLSSLANDIHIKYNDQFGFYQDSQEKKWKERFRKNEIYLEQIVKIAKSKNVEVSFLYIPAKEFFAKNGILGNITSNNLNDFNLRNPHYLQILNVCNRNNLKCYYANDFLFDKNPEDLYFPYDAHLNRKGHQVLASELLKEFP